MTPTEPFDTHSTEYEAWIEDNRFACLSGLEAVRVQLPEEGSCAEISVRTYHFTVGVKPIQLGSGGGSFLSTLYISNVDVVDGTPLLDIKPFIPALAKQYGAGIGWLADKYDEE